jgi:hypothetical protein
MKHDETFSSPEAKRRLSDRLRDLLLKQMTLVGAPQLLSALIPLAKVQSADGLAQAEGERGEMKVEQW